MVITMDIGDIEKIQNWMNSKGYEVTVEGDGLIDIHCKDMDALTNLAHDLMEVYDEQFLFCTGLRIQMHRYKLLDLIEKW